MVLSWALLNTQAPPACSFAKLEESFNDGHLNRSRSVRDLYVGLEVGWEHHTVSLV